MKVNEIQERLRGREFDSVEEYLTAFLAEAQGECEWTLDSNEHYEIWESACGQSWSFTDNLSLTEHNVRFCQGCGGKIKEKEISEQEQSK